MAGRSAEAIASAPGVIRTPEERFDGLPGFGFEPRYRELGGLRLAHLDEGDGPPLLMLHGEPTWSYLFRKALTPLRDAGYRCIVPDYPGFGRSDKPAELGWYSYERLTDACLELVESLGLRDVTIVGHDWGGPIGLRMAVERPEWFSRFVLIDTPLFTGRQMLPPEWWRFHDDVLANPDFPVGDFVAAGCVQPLGDDVRAAYDAPFAGAAAKAGVRAMPLHVLPRSPELPAARACWRVMKAIRRDSRPALILWGEHDFVFSRALAEWVAGALRRERPVMLAGAGHFAPEDQGEAIAGLIADWLG